jgi:protein TonB
MSGVHAVPAASPPEPPGSWRRLLWEVPFAAFGWLALLLALGLIVAGGGRQPPEEVVRLDARLVDLPPADAGGLQGGGGGGTPPAEEPAAEPAKPPPKEKAKPKEKEQVKKPPPAPPAVKHTKTAPPLVNVKHHAMRTRSDAPEDAGTASAGDGAAVASRETGGGVGGGSGGPGGSGGTGGGLGTSNVGARALYAPPPQVPDDLREDMFEAVALAHFQVDDDGHATVTLVKQTSSPRLNGILLAALKEWRFAPAVRNGLKVESEFDVRIPIAVR